MLYAFDLIELDGKDLRALPLGERKAKRLYVVVEFVPSGGDTSFPAGEAANSSDHPHSS
jgi:ATP-dependent DNA ligase